MFLLKVFTAWGYNTVHARKVTLTYIYNGCVFDLLWIFKYIFVSEACSSSSSSRCPVLECWFVQEKAGRGGGLTGATTQEKSLLRIRTDAESSNPESHQAPSNINPSRVYIITGRLNKMCKHTFIYMYTSSYSPKIYLNTSFFSFKQT